MQKVYTKNDDEKGCLPYGICAKDQSTPQLSEFQTEPKTSEEIHDEKDDGDQLSQSTTVADQEATTSSFPGHPPIPPPIESCCWMLDKSKLMQKFVFCAHPEIVKSYLSTYEKKDWNACWKILEKNAAQPWVNQHSKNPPSDLSNKIETMITNLAERAIQNNPDLSAVMDRLESLASSLGRIQNQWTGNAAELSRGTVDSVHTNQGSILLPNQTSFIPTTYNSGGANLNQRKPQAFLLPR